MKLAALAAGLAMLAGAHAQPLPDPGRRVDAPDTTAKPPLPKKERPRVTVKSKGGTGSSVGDDAPGGGPPTAQPSRGGTPGTPSGSFTGTPPRP